MNLKFTGHVGHLIFLCPGGGTSKEFLGCTPERLFKVQSKDGIVSKYSVVIYYRLVFHGFL